MLNVEFDHWNQLLLKNRNIETERGEAGEGRRSAIIVGVVFFSPAPGLLHAGRQKEQLQAAEGGGRRGGVGEEAAEEQPHHLLPPSAAHRGRGRGRRDGGGERAAAARSGSALFLSLFFSQFYF